MLALNLWKQPLIITEISSTGWFYIGFCFYSIVIFYIIFWICWVFSHLRWNDAKVSAINHPLLAHAITNHNQKFEPQNWNPLKIMLIFNHFLPFSHTYCRKSHHVLQLAATTTNPDKGRKRTRSCKSQELTFPANIDFNSIFISSLASNSASVQLPTKARGAALAKIGGQGKECGIQNFSLGEIPAP